GRPDLRDDEAPADREGSSRPLARPGRRTDGPGERLVDPALKRRLVSRIGEGDVPDVCRTLHDEPEFAFLVLADLAGVDTGTTMQVVYHLWSETSSDWLRVVADGLSRDDPRVPSVT